ncbi:3D-(3,5/4)-trihydroxycyclohexane-1,2-dione acylhydrolase (decyclizing) [Sphingomonas quercus]|uniref:3D-(3,5/4)-trihydroxycyclohexane-1,2-dione acylhydrolase (Decyclizing) n=1 Tax=Sphingomonas quercus TaxID=2842451 RepID=A0ABS6BGT2_9SPHN|nr:3D-(3,5/4)-trihydroxycyclohexane-1,2-dione acylhydrolase (decyclizing) [Sphingomonas quercus]
MSRQRRTAAQAAIAFLARQLVDWGEGPQPFFAGAWAIFGHGNVAGVGEALHASRRELPTWRAHNEQGMAHAAIGYARQMRRRRAMICTSSIGPGATNMVTAAALAHVNRLPVMFLPGDVYASRRPDPVLQQIEDFGDGTVSANDCFRPVSRYFDRITRPEQLLEALPRAMATLLDPADCGPVTLAFCQDVQAEAFDVPDDFLTPRLWRPRVVQPDPADIAMLAGRLRDAARPLLIVGGGVRYAGGEAALARLVSATGLPFAETQAGKGSLPHDHAGNLGSIGVTGSTVANQAAAEADLIVALGTRLQDFTTGSRALITGGPRLVQVNVAPFDAYKHRATPVVADARLMLEALTEALAESAGVPAAWADRLVEARRGWQAMAAEAMAPPAGNMLPSDAQVIGAVARGAPRDAVVVGAAGGLPGELHKLWPAGQSGGYHVEYGFSCMGYEIAGAIGVKMAAPGRDVYVMLGDGSYLMMNSELATAVSLATRIIVVLLDNRGFGCINRLQHATGGAPFNNLLVDAPHQGFVGIDFAAHAASLGAHAEKVDSIEGLEEALDRARQRDGSSVIVIDTDPMITTGGGAWWDVAVPEVSDRGDVGVARRAYEDRLTDKETRL